MIGVIGDAHFKDSLSYADYVSDGRVAEKKEILDFIVKSFKDCKHIVFMGDNFHSKNNSSETNREFVEFVERFGQKEIYILSGNHEKKGDGKTAIDFLREVNKKNWHIITKPESWEMGDIKDIMLYPYMLHSELGVDTSEEASKKIVKDLPGGDLLFIHHTISEFIANGIGTDFFTDAVLPRKKLESKYKLVVAGHIHEPQIKERTVLTGSVFTAQVGDIEKFIYKIKEGKTSGFDVEQIKLPCRPIHKLENPTKQELAKLEDRSIVKVVFTKRPVEGIEEVEKELSRFDAHLLLEDYPSGRKKMHIEKGAFDFSIEALLKLYAKEKGVDYQKLLKGYELIHG